MIGERHPQGNVWLAHDLSRLGQSLEFAGKFSEARTQYEKALAIYQRVHRDKEHRDIAASMHNLACCLHALGDYAAARGLHEDALAMKHRRFPRGHDTVAISLHDLALVLASQGDYREARRRHEESLAMRRRLYRHPNGHKRIAASLDGLASLLHAQGERQQALTYYNELLPMLQHLYPADRFPRGHAQVAAALSNLGTLLHSLGDFAAAERMLAKALAMKRTLYPEDEYPDGHPDLAFGLSWMGIAHGSLGNYEKAHKFARQALDMSRRFYAQGHPQLAAVVSSFGVSCYCLGDYDGACEHLSEALRMTRTLYPPDLYPHGHRELTYILHNLADALASQGQDLKQARRHFEEALEMQQRLREAFAATAAESEALNFVAQQIATRDLLIWFSKQFDQPIDQLYARLWHERGAVQQIIARRQRWLASGQPAEVRDQFKKYADTRRELAELILAPVHPGKDQATQRRKKLKDLSREKEELERKLAAMVPEFRRQLALRRSSHTDLVDALPQGSVFVSLWRYYDRHHGKNRRGREGVRFVPSYIAFVLRPNLPIAFADLGPAEPIDKAVEQWRGDIAASQPTSAAAGVLSRLVWAKIAEQMPAETDTIYLCPDAALTRLPWAALPGKQKNTVLLEDYALALVPHGPFLLGQLQHNRATDIGTGRVLAVGDADYDASPDPGPGAGQWAQISRRRAAGDAADRTWDPLPGTADELAMIARMAQPRPVQKLDKSRASTPRVLALLPTARYAHFATHGFFAGPEVRSILQLDEQEFRRFSMFRVGERSTVVGRNPLVMSGLVLAGANRPRPEDDGGLLTGEALASLPLTPPGPGRALRL